MTKTGHSLLQKQDVVAVFNQTTNLANFRTHNSLILAIFSLIRMC